MKRIILILFIAASLSKTTASFAQVSAQDSLALVDLYNNTGGPGWTATWNFATPVNTWYGVGVSGTSVSLHVTTISLASNNLTGSIPSSISNLSSLQGLNLSANQISGTIPSSVGLLSNLKYLYLINNQLSGSIPSSLGQLSALKYLYLGSNQLSGTIPSSLDNMTALTNLYLGNNQFTFDGMEAIANAYSIVQYSPQANIPLNYNGGTLSVSAGGTLANDTFHWYKDNLLYQTIVGDSELTVSINGAYSVAVTNAAATALTLYSDTFDISTLPVKILYFTATKNNSENLLQWSSAGESGSSYYAIERSNDNTHYSTIGNVNAKGYTTATTDYSFTDNNPNNGTNYYRLRMVNKDGTFTYSQIRTLSNTVVFTANIYPNPVQTTLSLNFSTGQAASVQIEIINNEGKKMLSKQIQLPQGASTQSISTASFSNGIYYVKCLTGSSETALKFVKGN